MAQQPNPWAVVQTKPLAPNDPWAVVSSQPVTTTSAGPQKVGGGYGVLAEIGDQAKRVVSRTVSNLATPFTQSPIKTIKDVVMSPVHAIEGQLTESEQAVQKAIDAFKRGDRTKGTLDLIASFLPTIGPIGNATRRRIESGEGAEVAGDVLSMMAGPAIAKTIPKGIKIGGGLKSTNPAEAEALRYVQSQGVPANAAAVTGNDAIKGAMAAAEKTTIFGSRIGKASEAATQKGLSTLGEQLAAKAGRGTPTTMLAAGEEAAGTLTGKVKAYGKAADAPYEKIRAAEKAGTVTGVNIGEFQKNLKPVYDQLVRESQLVPPQGSTAKALVALDRLMNAEKHAPLSVADGALGELKAALRKMGESEPWSKGSGVLRQAVDELDKRVMETAKVHKLDMDLMEGRQATRAKYEVADVLDDLGKEPAATVQKLLGQKDRAVTQLREIRKHAPEAVGEMGRAYLDDLFGQAEKAGGFNKTDKLFAEWSKLGTATKKELFADALKKNPDYLSNLDRFFLAAKKLSENPNPSGSGIQAMNAARGTLAAGGLINPKSWVLLGMYEAGGAATAAALRSPKIARLLTRGVTVPMPTRAAKAAYLASLSKAFQSEGLPVPAFASGEPQKEPVR